LKNQYKAVRAKFQTTLKNGKKQERQNWYGMRIDQLATKLERDGEYRLWYRLASVWAHGDSASAGWAAIETLFQALLQALMAGNTRIIDTESSPLAEVI